MKTLLSTLVITIVLAFVFTSCGESKEEKKTGPTGPTDQQIIKQLESQIAEFEKQQKAADSTKIATDAANQVLQDSLNKLSLPVPTCIAAWSMDKIKEGTSYFTNGSFGNIHYHVVDVFGKATYEMMRAAFIATPTLWQKAFNSQKPLIGWLKETLSLPDSVPSMQVNYLKGKYDKKYEVKFKKFFAIHTNPKFEGNPFSGDAWTEFETDFFKSFPDAFDGKKDGSKLAEAYKQWRSAWVIKKPQAKTILATIIEGYNAL